MESGEGTQGSLAQRPRGGVPQVDVFVPEVRLRNPGGEGFALFGQLCQFTRDLAAIGPCQA